VAVPQQVIDLFNLSLPALRDLSSRSGKKIAAGATKAEIIEELSDVPRQKLEQDAGDVLYAGNTSITWLRLASGRFTTEQLRRAITALEDGNDPFAAPLRPAQIGYVPRLVEARSWGTDKIVMTFVVRKRVQTVIRNFEIEPVYADDFFQVVARPSKGLFEVRASHDRARTLERTWLISLAELMDTNVDYALIGYSDFDKLRTKLAAVLDGYKGKDSSGSIYDTMELSRSDTCPNLADEQQFKDDTKHLVPISADIIFTSPGQGHEVRLKISANGSVWFRSSVSESVIDQVFAALEEVGAL
jgi:hypothetical protein